MCLQCTYYTNVNVRLWPSSSWVGMRILTPGARPMACSSLSPCLFTAANLLVIELHSSNGAGVEINIELNIVPSICKIMHGPHVEEAGDGKGVYPVPIWDWLQHTVPQF